MRRKTLLAAALCAFFLHAAFADEQGQIRRQYQESLVQASEGKHFTVELKVGGAGLRIGGNSADLVLYDSLGNDVENADIDVVPAVSGTPYQSAAQIVVSESGAGFYTIDNIVIPRGGTWALQITVRKSGVKDSLYVELPKLAVADGKAALPPQGSDASQGGAEEALPETKTVDEAAEEATPEVQVDQLPEHHAVAAEPAAVPVSDAAKFKRVLRPLPALAPFSADNPVTPDKLKLGRMLFWERRLSETAVMSCADCHRPSYFGAEPAEVSGRAHGSAHERNAGTVLNAAFSSALLWTGEYASVEELCAEGMGDHEGTKGISQNVIDMLNSIPEYRALSENVFHRPLDVRALSQALAAYVRSLATPDYPLARWLQGDDQALTDEQVQGMALFFGKGCSLCHSGPAFGGSAVRNQAVNSNGEGAGKASAQAQYHRVEVPGAENDLGLAGRTGREEHKYFFRSPSLLNVAQTPPYSHAGRIHQLDAMVRFMAASMLKLELDDGQVRLIAAFLHSLTGEMPLHFMTVPVLPAGSAGELSGQAP